MEPRRAGPPPLPDGTPRRPGSGPRPPRPRDGCGSPPRPPGRCDPGRGSRTAVDELAASSVCGVGVGVRGVSRWKAWATRSATTTRAPTASGSNGTGRRRPASSAPAGDPVPSRIGTTRAAPIPWTSRKPSGAPMPGAACTISPVSDGPPSMPASGAGRAGGESRAARGSSSAPSWLRRRIAAQSAWACVIARSTASRLASESVAAWPMARRLCRRARRTRVGSSSSAPGWAAAATPTASASASRRRVMAARALRISPSAPSSPLTVGSIGTAPDGVNRSITARRPGRGRARPVVRRRPAP